MRLFLSDLLALAGRLSDQPDPDSGASDSAACFPGRPASSTTSANGSTMRGTRPTISRSVRSPTWSWRLDAILASASPTVHTSGRSARCASMGPGGRRAGRASCSRFVPIERVRIARTISPAPSRRCPRWSLRRGMSRPSACAWSCRCTGRGDDGCAARASCARKHPRAADRHPPVARGTHSRRADYARTTGRTAGVRSGWFKRRAVAHGGFRRCCLDPASSSHLSLVPREEPPDHWIVTIVGDEGATPQQIIDAVVCGRQLLGVSGIGSFQPMRAHGIACASSCEGPAWSGTRN